MIALPYLGFSGGSEIEIAGGADGWCRKLFAFRKSVGGLIADDGAEFGVNRFLLFAVADAAVEVGAVADVALVLIGPADKSVVLVCGFHGGNLLCGF